MISKQTLIVGTYNVQNMFTRADIRHGMKIPVKSRTSLNALAENIRQADADIVALQECTSRQTLSDFLENHNLSENYPHIAHVSGNDFRGVNVAVISKYPFTEVTSHKDVRFPLVDGSGEGKFSRDFLRVDVDINGNNEADFTLYTAHSRSRLPVGSVKAEVKRISEAKAMREIAESEMKRYPQRLFVITGDLNDGSQDTSLQTLLKPSSEQEEWVDSLADKPREEQITWPSYRSKYNDYPAEQLDHIIFPKSAQKQLANSKVNCYNNNASDHFLLTSEFYLYQRE
ncbi:endonuclease/exonuclease/phosphatase family protein [bacterium]|nr:endonuclease/exonuclease/phosphatase family protein [bacterium]